VIEFPREICSGDANGNVAAIEPAFVKPMSGQCAGQYRNRDQNVVAFIGISATKCSPV